MLLQRGEEVASPLGLCCLGVVGPQFSVVCLAGVQWLVSKRLLFCRAAPFLVLWLNKENRLLLGFFLSALLAVFGLPASSLLILRYIRQKENPDTLSLDYFSVPKVPSLFVFFHLSESYVCFMYNVQAF